jgi:CRISPR-associated protein Cas6
MTDIAFDLSGAATLPADSMSLLARSIARRLPWIDDEPLVGMHPLRATPSVHGALLLARRAKLVLRIPARRAADARLLAGTSIDIGGGTLCIGAGRERALSPSATLAAQRVESDATDAAAFEAEAQVRLRALGIECALIAGLRREERIDARMIAGFALTLHALSPAASLRVLGAGLGALRRFGWGVFVPARAIRDLPAATD